MTQLATAPAQPRLRDPFFDNAKFLAILLVVVGHALEPVRDVHLAMSVYVFVYLFHMPLFIMITGYFSRSFTRATDRTRKLVATLAAPYLIFQVAYLAYERLFGDHDIRLQLFDPYGLMWFLVAVLLWRVSTPFWQRVRWPLAIAVALSLHSSVYGLPDVLNLHNVVGLMPFYVLGLMLRPEHFELLRRTSVRVGAAIVLLAAAGWSWRYGRAFDRGWLYWGGTYRDHQVGVPQGMLMLTGMLLAGAVLALAVLTLVPRRRAWFTELGANTMYVYLLHWFFVRTARHQGWYDPQWLHTVLGTGLVVTVSAALGALLSTAAVRRTFRRLVEPTVSWLFSEPGGQTRMPTRSARSSWR
ncbi:MAG: acyltransferase family protein [Streptosporangiaceae bacterium]